MADGKKHSAQGGARHAGAASILGVSRRWCIGLMALLDLALILPVTRLVLYQRLHRQVEATLVELAAASRFGWSTPILSSLSLQELANATEHEL